MSVKKQSTDKEAQFVAVTAQYKEVIAKVCYMYASAAAPFDDLYQEVLINLWQGLDSFRGEAKISTWIYRTAINTCITWHRRNDRHSGSSTLRLDELLTEPADTASGRVMLEEYRELYRLIGMLGPLDKALITLWLDEKSYEEIALIMGLSKGNVAVKMHRVKEKLSRLADAEA
ncbi:MAG: sigma-70 family RNA polymerase sigma factor [Muribaculaceae bacterium]|nr:sigma-70 family RNA polymerase sigma factor [Muribaculaceae bacterium]